MAARAGPAGHTGAMSEQQIARAIAQIRSERNVSFSCVIAMREHETDLLLEAQALPTARYATLTTHPREVLT